MRSKQPSEIIEIPSPQVLRARLERILSEAKRLRLLIRTGQELERIAIEREQKATDSHEVAK